MSAIVQSDQSAHWYAKDGTPCHTVISKSTGQPRSTTLRDARKMGLLPSVTTIDSILAKPALTNWKVEMGIVAALTTQRNDGEDLQDFAKRVAGEAQGVTDAARDLGTRLHGVAELFSRDWSNWPTDDQIDEDLRPYLPHFRDFFDRIERVISSECVVVGEGYAGRVDLIAEMDGSLWVLDFKSKKFKDGECEFWPENLRQLVAYMDAITGLGHFPVYRLANVGINTLQPSPFVLHEWTPDQFEHARNVFQATLKLWQTMNKYSPGENNAI